MNKKSTVHLALDPASNRWYLTYIINNRQLDEFAATLWYHPDLHFYGGKVWVDIHPSREYWVLETAMDFAKYFDLELEIM